MKIPSSLLLASLSLALAPPLLANETLAVLPDSAAALGIAGGRYANLDDPSVVRTNPASMLGIDAPAIEVNGGAWYGDIHFTNSAGAGVQMQDPWKYLGSAYFVDPVVPGRLAFGFGVSTPYGISSKWPEDGALKYLIPYEASLLTVDFTPAVAIRLTDNLSIGAGMEVMYSTLYLKQQFPWSALTGQLIPDGDFLFDGTGWGVGGYMSINWKPAPGHRLALIGRLPMSVQYDGTFTAGGMPSTARALGFTPTSPFQSNFNYPGSLAAGYGWDINDHWTVGFDAMWTANASQKDLPLLVGANQALLGKTGAALNWQDSWEGGASVQYKINENWKIRAGYLYAAASQPDQTYIPSIASNQRHLLTLGVGWTSPSKKDRIDFTYGYLIYPNRNISNDVTPGFNGKYSISWNVTALSYTHSF